MEPRKHQRFGVQYPVRYTGDTTSEGKGMVFNLSAEGCAIGSDAPPEKGEYLRLAISVEGSDELQVELAVVRWTAVGRFGIEFIRVSGEHQSRLRELAALLES